MSADGYTSWPPGWQVSQETTPRALRAIWQIVGGLAQRYSSPYDAFAGVQGALIALVIGLDLSPGELGDAELVTLIALLNPDEIPF